jgi:hypothetical protein
MWLTKNLRLVVYSPMKGAIPNMDLVYNLDYWGQQNLKKEWTVLFLPLK